MVMDAVVGAASGPLASAAFPPQAITMVVKAAVAATALYRMKCVM
jgi:hypothetical protein